MLDFKRDVLEGEFLDVQRNQFLIFPKSNSLLSETISSLSLLLFFRVYVIVASIDVELAFFIVIVLEDVVSDLQANSSSDLSKVDTLVVSFEN